MFFKLTMAAVMVQAVLSWVALINLMWGMM